MTWRLFEDRRVVPLDQTPKRMPGRGFLWWDLVRDEAEGWERTAERLTDVAIVSEHLTDGLNEQHPPFYDGTGSYDMLIFREVRDADLANLETSPIAVFLVADLVVTVRAEGCRAVPRLISWMSKGAVRVPAAPVRFIHRLLTAVTDEYMALRDPISNRLEAWQDQILDPDRTFDDWRSLVTLRAPLRRLQTLCRQHVDAVQAWSDDPLHPFDEEVTIRFNDIVEHHHRVLAHVQHAQTEIEGLVQLHFAATAHRTNEIMKMLTLIAAIFLPLGLVAGIFGMNFQHMFGMDHPWAYPGVLIGMLAVAVVMVFLFRRKHWL